MTHELFHAELHHRAGRWALMRNIIPRWFNEGMAVHLSGDTRFHQPWSKRDRQWARAIVSLEDWKANVTRDTWRKAYGASAAIVANLEDRVGRPGVLDLINRVIEENADFDVEFDRIMKSDGV